jgi:hypothetical protein
VPEEVVLLPPPVTSSGFNKLFSPIVAAPQVNFARLRDPSIIDAF